MRSISGRRDFGYGVHDYDIPRPFFETYLVLPLHPVMLYCVQPQKAFHLSLGRGLITFMGEPHFGHTGTDLVASIFSLCCLRFAVAVEPFHTPIKTAPR